MNIQQAVPLLVERLRQQKVILFVGAGLSQASGLPGWKKLFERFCKELGCPEEENFPAVATSLIQENIHNRKEIIEHIVQQIGAVNLELNPNHEWIKRLTFNIIITTNYDNLLEDLYGASRLTRIYSDENMAYFDPLSAKRQLIYLHGDINHPDHMVVSSIDFQNFSEDRPIMVERLKTLLQDYTFLFTGYSANDPNLQAVFDHFRLTYKENANRHFIVMADPGIVKQNEFRTRFGLEPVLLKDKTELTSFLQALVEAYENPDRAPTLGREEEAGEPADRETGKTEANTDTEFVDDFIKARGQKTTGAAQSPTPMPPGFQTLKPFNVPGADPHFTGREMEMEVLKKALLDKQTMAVSGLFGMGGIGKTSLAKQVAHQLHKEGRFKDGICWHRLEAKELPVSLEEMADVFGAAWLKEIKPLESQVRYFQAVIQDRDLLFILDNAEYLEHIPPLLDLLRNHPILITSRRRLTGLANEMDLHRLDNQQSFQLFIKTWKQVDRVEEIDKITAAFSIEELAAMQSVCTGLLGNLPLALTIAGGVLRYKKIDITGFHKLLEEKRLSLLQDPNNVYKTEAKDKNVRLSFDFSFDQLPAGGIEQSLFAVMGIFGGEDFSREALVAIFQEENKEAIDNGVEILEQLSMVQVRDNQRLYLHPLLRQYALEKLPGFKGDAAYEAMAGYYLDLVRNNPQALHYEWKNALPFVDWCLAHSREKDGLLLIAKIDWFLYKTGQWTSREEWLKKGIEIANRIENVLYLFDFINLMQDLYARQGRISERKEVLNTLSDECRRFKTLENQIPWINYILASSFLNSNEIGEAYVINLKNIKESLFYGKKEVIGAIYRNLGNICRRSGLLPKALHFYQANLVIDEKFGTKDNKIRAVSDVGDIYLDLGQWTEALEWFKRYEAELAENPHKELEACLYESYFFYYLETGETGKAQDYLNKYKETGKEFGSVTYSGNLIYYEGLLEKAGGHYEKAISTFEKALQFYRDTGREDKTGTCFLNRGICDVKLENTRKAREHLQATGEIFKKYRIEPLMRCLQEAYYALLEARSAYDEQAVRLITRAQNTYRHMGIENLRELQEIETEIRREIGEDRFNTLLNHLKESGTAEETIDFGAGFLQVDPEIKEIVSPLDHREMALIPAGFIESPHYEHPLYLYPFYMDRYPVTNRDYKKFTDAMAVDTPPYWPGGKIPPGMEDHPVVGITFDEAMAYAQWAGKDLPLKEEWEIAAGLGEGYSCPWGNETADTGSYFIIPNEKLTEKNNQKVEIERKVYHDEEVKKLILNTKDHFPLLLKMEIPPHSLKFNEAIFLRLLAGSLSLSIEEKIKIVESIPKLSQYQVDELQKLFIEERKKFIGMIKYPLYTTDLHEGKILPGMKDHPVVGISQDEALAYAQWAGKDLPFQEEWEKIVGIDEGYSLPWGDETEDTDSNFLIPDKTIMEKNEAESIQKDVFHDEQLKQLILNTKEHLFILKMEIPPHSLKFNKAIFLRLLAGSLSLTKEEKIKIVESMPKLSQYQVDELQKIFIEERKKFLVMSKAPLSELISDLVLFFNNEQIEQIKELNETIKTYPVTQFKDNRSPFGICDLLGNVFEYTQSFSNPGYRNSPVILKGFSWLRSSFYERNDITDGHYSFTHQRWADVGFRCVKRIFRKEDAQLFIDDGDKAKDWESLWWFDRARHTFDTLSSEYFYEPIEPLIARGITCCQNLLALSPGHKKAVYLLTRFFFHREELRAMKEFFDNTLYPLLAGEKEAAPFNWNRLRDILSTLPAREEEKGTGTNPVTRQQNLEELTAKIDRLLAALEEDMIIAGLKLTGRTTIESLEYLLNRYEEKFSFLQYTVILFLCLIKMKINKEKETLAAWAEIAMELLTPKLEMGKESIAAIKVSNRGLAPVEDVSIELSDRKPPQKYNGKHLEIARRQFTIPHLVSSEILNLETVVTAHKTGTFTLYMTAGYTNPAAPEGKQESRQTFTASLKITTPQPVTADTAETIAADGTAARGFSLSNPYYTGRPIQEPDMYFGREDVLERIEKRLGPNNIIILYGQRRTGKTSTLFQLKNRVYRQTAVPVILDIQAMMGDDTSFLFYRMASDLYETMVRSDIAIPTHLAEPVLEDYKNKPQYKYELFLKKAVKAVKEKPIIYLVDEFDGLFYMIKEKQVEPTVLDNLRSIMQHYQQVWFILAGTHLIKSEAADSRSALFNIATYEKIGALEEKDARALITQPLQGKVEYEPYAVDKIISLTNCNPYFIQAICFEMVYYLEEHGLRRVTLKELQEVVDKLFRQGSSHFDQFWTYLSKPESLLLSLLAENTREYENSISLDRVREICKGRIDPKVDIYNVITQLQEKDFLVRREYLGKPHVGFFMELFKRWILIHHPLESYELSGGAKE